MTTGARFQIIQELMQCEDNVLNIKDLCQIAGISRSGYYNRAKSADKRAGRKQKDREDFELIRQACEYRGYPKGARSIQMRLLHSPEPVKMNQKKILRLMNHLLKDANREFKSNSRSCLMQRYSVLARRTRRNCSA